MYQNEAATRNEIIDKRLLKAVWDVWYWLQFQYENNRNIGGGSSQQALNCQRVKDLPFILPPFKEQEKIVERINQYFETASIIEKQIEKAELNVAKLSRAILAKTFNQE